MKNMSLYFAIGFLTASISVGFGCGGGGSTDSTQAAKDSNAAKMDSTRDTTRMASVPPTVSTADQKFVVDAVNGGMTEIEAGRLAQQQGVSADVKKYGAMLVKDHEEANEKLKAIAAKKNLTLPATISPEMQESISGLQKKTGKEFDKAFLDMMVSDHKKVISAFQDESKNGSDADIRSFADGTLHTLQHHLDEAQRCRKMESKM
jgi:putative membrane protein